MKKYLMTLIPLVLCCVALSSYAGDVSEKVLRSFKETFPHAQNVSWQTTAERYIAQFQQNGIQSIVKYDPDGNILEATRYYKKDNLPIRIICKLKRDYPGKSIFGVTEVMVNESTHYYVKMEDQTTWTTVKTDEEGNGEIVEQFEKQL